MIVLVKDFENFDDVIALKIIKAIILKLVGIFPRQIYSEVAQFFFKLFD